LVQEAIRLFESDTKRQPYTPRHNKFLVSPLNAREELSKYLKGAKQELLIYDSKVSDMAMIRILKQRTAAGVSVRIIGHVPSRNPVLPVGKLPHIRLHTRTIVRDRKLVFIGSQSLRELELDARREVGVILRDSKVVNTIVRTFEADWSTIETSAGEPTRDSTTLMAAKAAAKAAEAVTKDLPPVAPVVEKLVQQAVRDAGDVELDHAELEASVRDAVEHAVRTTVKEMVEEVTEQNEPA
jgi:phosphatidylserine/phosphatidylglycerophosphate/cardiolipin synthase-like enzyme